VTTFERVQPSRGKKYNKYSGRVYEYLEILKSVFLEIIKKKTLL